MPCASALPLQDCFDIHVRISHVDFCFFRRVIVYGIFSGQEPLFIIGKIDDNVNVILIFD